MNVEIYSKDECKFCTAAIAYFETRALNLTIHKLDVDFTREELKAKFPAARTFPQIIVNGTHTGGWDDTKKVLGIP